MNSEPSSRRVFNITVTEILFVLIFAITAAVVVSQIELDKSIDEIDVLETQYNELKKEFDVLSRKFKELEQENRKLKEEIEFLNQVIDELTVGPQVGADVAALRREIAKLKREIKNLKEIIKMKDNLISTLGGTGLHKCTYGNIPIKQLFRVYVYDEYFEFIPLWKISDEGTFLKIEWIKDVNNKKTYSNNEFVTLGNKHLNWGNSQDPKCRYQVRTYDRTENAASWIKQRDEVDNKFIACHIKPESEDPTNRENEECRGFN